MKRHIPIMVKEILSFIPDDVKIIVDGTFGHGGHSIEILSYKSQVASYKGLMLCMERDPRVVEHGKQYLITELKNRGIDIGVKSPDLELNTQHLKLLNDSYTNIAQYLPPGQKAGFVLLDLGINREHVTDNER